MRRFNSFLRRGAILFGVAANGFLALAQLPNLTLVQPQPLFHPAPPAGFDPVSASDAELRTYGLPSRPPVVSAAYATWVNRMRNVKTRVPNPIAYTRPIQHRRATLMSSPIARTASPNSGGTSFNATTENWSGVVATGTNGYFLSDGSFVTISFQVPTVLAPRTDPSCIYAPYQTGIWGGIDGYGTTNVLQAGVVIESNCRNAFYMAFYEWHVDNCQGGEGSACFETGIFNFAVHPGDSMYTTVTYHTSDPKGNAFFSNQTTGNSYRFLSIKLYLTHSKARALNGSLNARCPV